MYVRALMLKHSVRSSSRELSAFIKMKVYNDFNSCTVPDLRWRGLKPRAVHTGKKNYFKMYKKTKN